MRSDGEINLRRIKGRTQWEHLTPMTLTLDDGRKFTINAGDTTDKASTYGIIIERDDRQIIEAALYHDQLYVVQKIEGQWVSRLEIDNIFIDICKNIGGMPWIKRAAVRAFVRLFGWVKFNDRAREIGNLKL